MKNIFDILAGVGLTVPEDKRTDFEAAFNENYKTVNDYSKVKTARDNFKSQLDTATETLKSFEGVDVKELQGRIATLTTDLANSKADYESKLAERDFNDLVSAAAQKFKAKDLKAVMPFLDVEKLKGSKNQTADIESAFEQVKKDKAYLFDDEKAPKLISYTSGPDQNTNNANTKANDALRSLFRKE